MRLVLPIPLSVAVFVLVLLFSEGLLIPNNRRRCSSPRRSHRSRHPAAASKKGWQNEKIVRNEVENVSEHGGGAGVRMSRKQETRRRKRKQYSLNGGYTYGDKNSLLDVFSDANEKLTFEALHSSKYLRFWPGRVTEAKDMWDLVCGEDGCTLEELFEFHNLLDIAADAVYKTMENERTSWEEENLVSNLLETYFRFPFHLSLERYNFQCFHILSIYKTVVHPKRADWNLGNLFLGM